MGRRANKGAEIRRCRVSVEGRGSEKCKGPHSSVLVLLGGVTPSVYVVGPLGQGVTKICKFPPPLGQGVTKNCKFPPRQEFAQDQSYRKSYGKVTKVMEKLWKSYGQASKLRT